MTDIKTALRNSVSSGDDFIIATALYRFMIEWGPDSYRAEAILERRYPKFLKLKRDYARIFPGPRSWGDITR